MDEVLNLTDAEIEYYKDIDSEDIEAVNSSKQFLKVTYDRNGNVTEMIEIDEATAIKESKEAKKKDQKFKEKMKKLKESKKNKSVKEKEEIDREIVSVLSSWDDSKDNSWIELEGVVTRISSTTYHFRMDWNWKYVPGVRMNDVVGITHNEDWSITPDSFIAKNEVDIRDIDSDKLRETSTELYSNPSKTDVNGQALRFPVTNGVIYDSSYDYLDNIRGYMAYRVKKGNSSITYSNMYGHYEHQIIPGFLGVSINAGSLSVSPNTNYSSSPTLNVQFSVQ